MLNVFFLVGSTRRQEECTCRDLYCFFNPLSSWKNLPAASSFRVSDWERLLVAVVVVVVEEEVVEVVEVEVEVQKVVEVVEVDVVVLVVAFENQYLRNPKLPAFTQGHVRTFSTSLMVAAIVLFPAAAEWGRRRLMPL